MKYTLATIAFALLMPLTASAATLTSQQVSSIIGLLIAFNVDPPIIANVLRALLPEPVAAAPQPPMPDTPEYVNCKTLPNGKDICN